MLNKYKVIVTGGAGFIGSHLVDRYIDEGCEVVVVDDLSSGSEVNLNKKAKFYKADIQDPSLRDIFEREKPDIVNHHAAQKDVRLSVSDPILDARINILGTINLLENAVKYGVKKFIFASSGGAIYGDQETFPAPETHSTKPISPYGIAKLVAEHYMYYYRKEYGLDYVSLRYANVYGPRQDPHGEAGVIAIFVHKMLRGERPVVNGDGEQTRDFVYVDDVVEVNLKATMHSTAEGIFNIGTGVETTINELYDNIRNIINPGLGKVHGVAMPGEQRRSVIDFRRACQELGWHPKADLTFGLKKACDYFANT